MIRPNALFLAAEAPYPIIGGGPNRAASVLEYLTRRFSVHGIFFREPGAPDPVAAIPPGKLDRADVVELPFHSRHPIARVLRNASRLARNRSPLLDRFSGFETQIERFLTGQQYQAAFIEHFWCAPYVDQVRPHAQARHSRSVQYRIGVAPQHGFFREWSAGLGPQPIRARDARIGALLAAQSAMAFW